ncbi:beta-ketoacyl synthase domain-containing protein [Colletotrichum caudatum]|nr:beta-ketoacyl synthase domain-containing protein [Colletotrichum caudatum]
MEEPIAIVGVSARLPGDGDTPERFFESLLAGRSARTEVPRERYNADSFWHPDADRSGATRVRHGHFLRGSISAFDAPFFSITPTEARSIDPQQRGMLESVYKALENAGIPLDTVAGSRTGVYVGCFTADYNDHIAKDLDIPNKYSALGTVASMLSNRVSWFFDFRGPSVTVDTACSSSLVAVHEACMSLKLREISMAVVGGCNLILTPEMTLKLDAAGVLGPDGKSYSFDHRANGYARGEGFGTVVLKRVSDAVRDGDVIRAVIRNSSTNQDGRSPGITQPTKAGQVALIRHVYDRANLDPSLTRFAEAHGTGTPVGDPIEASALADVFAPHRSPDEPLFVGALKSNVGHLEGAAGVAAVIKGVLTLESGVIPGNIWFEKKNPKIQDSWRLKFPTEPTVWPQRGLRRMSINSFGVGGSNAHVVMDDALHFLESHRLNGNHRTEASPRIPRHLITGLPVGDHAVNRPRRSDSGVEMSGYGCEDLPRLFVLSANDPGAASRLGKLYEGYVSAKVAEGLGEAARLRFLRDLGYTLASRRTHHAWRSVSIAGSPGQLQKALEGGLAPTRTKASPRLAFVFTGQGAQWAAMGMDLLAYRAFQESLFAADRYLNDIGCRWSLTFELSKPKSSSRIDDPEFCQPICTALQVALVDLLTTWGIHPHAITGHSSGEVAAAYAAGAISREAAWRVAYHRGRLGAELARSESRPRTGMAAVGLDKAGTEAAIARVNHQLGGGGGGGSGGGGTLEIACMNSPDSHTVSGDARMIDHLVEMLGGDGVFARKLNVEVAYHSRYMEPMADEYLRAMGELEQGVPKGPFEPRFYSSTVGAPVALSQLRQPDYWVRNLVSPVRFTESVTEMLKGSSQPRVNGHVDGVNEVNGHEAATDPITDFLEIGPHSALKGPLSSTAKQVRGASSRVDYHSVLRRHKSAVETTLETAGSLWCQGYSVRLAQVNEADEPHGPRPLMLTNLPSYPFDHSKEYWVESTLSDRHRKRHAGRHELLGAPMPGFNESNAAWRNYLRLTESPWIEDHKVSGDVLYPAAGMLVMAIEASRQVADGTKALGGFRFRDVSFKLALRVPDDADGVESQFYLRRHRESSVPASAPSAWKEFQLWTLQNGEWREHCHGFVQTEYEPDDDLALPSIQGRRMSDGRGCTTEVSVDELYLDLSRSGLHFGPAFRTLNNVRLGQDLNLVATVDSPGERIRKAMPHQYVQPHLVHPATLDAVVHASLVPLASSAEYSNATRVPTYLADGWVSARPELPHDSYDVSAVSRLRGRDEVTAEVTATHPGQGHTMVHMSGLLFKSIPHEATKDARDASTHPAYNIAWKPDPGFLSREQASGLFELPLAAEDDPSRWMKDCEALCLAYIRRHVLDTPKEAMAGMTWYHQRYAAWFQHVVRQASNEGAGEAIADLEARVAASGAPEGRLVMAVGNALGNVLGGKRDPLDVIFKDKLAEDVYRDGLGSRRCYAQLCGYLDALAHKNPAMEVLEIGAGTGGATRPAMATLTRGGRRRYGRYDFTDISPSFFEQARETFRDELAHMAFRVLDVEDDPLAQGFEAGRYDVVVAANVLHATRRVDETLANARRLLKPGGALLLFEITNTEVLLGGFCFGVLPGWWLSEDKDRVWGPLMSTVSWGHHLTGAGFGGLDAVFHDFPSSPNQMSSVLVSTVPRPDEALAPPTQSYVLTSGTPAQLGVAKRISQRISVHGSCDVTTAEAVASKSLAGSACVVLSEFDKPCLADMTEDGFDGLKRVLVQSKVILWVTRGGAGAVPEPDAELVTGLARVVRAERPDVRFLVASFEATASDDAVADKCVQILQNARRDAENSFRIVDDVVNVPRLVQAGYLTEHLQAQTGPPSVASKPLGDDTSRRPLALRVGDIGRLDSLRFEDDVGFDAPLGRHDVEFQTMACGLTARDLSSALGRTDESPLGCEASGIVTRAGSSSRFRAGDRVFGLSVTGAIKTRVRTTDGLLAKLPDGVSWARGAALPADYTTAYAVLCEFGSLRRGDAVLVQDGASALGQALIQVAKLQDAEVYATVDSRAERDALAALCGIPPDRIFGGSLGSSLRDATKGRGVNLFVNTAEAPGLINDAAGCVAPFGRIVAIGLETPVPAGARLPRGRNIRLESFDLAACASHDLARTEAMFQRMVDLVSANWGGMSRPAPAAVYSFSQVRDAFRRLQSEGRNSKVVLEPRDRDVIPVLSGREPASLFDPEASYVVAGGLGGLGRSVARWMASRGARNLVLLSRRGAVEKPAIELVNELESVCDNVVTPTCDVADEKALIDTMKEVLTSLPPVKGCIQGSMVLQDNLVQNMSLDDWKAATLPKVDGSRNLRNVLGDKTDFFVFLSSFVSVIGSPGQANYAAGGSFQDALAREMAARGINAVSVDLPIVEGVGYVAEKPELRDHLRSTGWTHISEEELHAVLDYHCRPRTGEPTDVSRAQVIPRLWLPRETAVAGRRTQSWGEDPLFSHLRHTGGDDDDEEEGEADETTGKALDHKALLQGAASREEAEGVVLDALLLKIARMLSIEVPNLEVSRPLHAYGIDSLTAVELRSWLVKELGAEVTVFDITSNSSISRLAATAAAKSSLAPHFSRK